LLVAEITVLIYFARAVWILPWLLAPLLVAIELPTHAFRGWPRIGLALAAALYAGAYVFPGAMAAVLSSCGGIMASTCLPGEFERGAAAYLAGAAVNIWAACIVAARAHKTAGREEQRETKA
jgi:hypothetical protein